MNYLKAQIFHLQPIFLDIFQFFEADEELEDNLYYAKKTDGIEIVLDSIISKSTRGKDYMEYLVQWKDKLVEDSSCITQDDFDIYDSSKNITIS